MPDIRLLADKAARVRRVKNLTIPGAVWAVLRAEKFANKPDAKELHGDICSELQRRATARRKKNKREGRTSPKVPEQLELKIDPRHKEAARMAAERGDHLLSDS